MLHRFQFETQVKTSQGRFLFLAQNQGILDALLWTEIGNPVYNPHAQPGDHSPYHMSNVRFHPSTVPRHKRRF